MSSAWMYEMSKRLFLCCQITSHKSLLPALSAHSTIVRMHRSMGIWWVRTQGMDSQDETLQTSAFSGLSKEATEIVQEWPVPIKYRILQQQEIFEETLLYSQFNGFATSLFLPPVVGIPGSLWRRVKNSRRVLVWALLFTNWEVT